MRKRLGKRAGPTKGVCRCVFGVWAGEILRYAWSSRAQAESQVGLKGAVASGSSDGRGKSRSSKVLAPTDRVLR